MTPLMLASRDGHVDVVKTLLDRGAATYLTDGGTWTALEWAKVGKNSDIVRLIKEARTRYALVALEDIQ